MTSIDELREDVDKCGLVSSSIVDRWDMQCRLMLELCKRQDRTNALLSGGVIPALERVADALETIEAYYKRRGA